MIRQQQPTNCLSVFDHFVGLALKGLKGMKPEILTFEGMHFSQKYRFIFRGIFTLNTSARIIQIHET